MSACVVAACGTGGLANANADQSQGGQLFTQKCAGCHTLKAAAANGKSGPNLDDAIGGARDQKMSESTIRAMVANQIKFAVPPMPQNLVTGDDVDAVAAFVAAYAGTNKLPAGSAAAKNTTNGNELFTQNCGSCHTLAAAGTSGSIGPNLDQLKPSFERARSQVEHGGGAMPAFKGQLTDKQIAAVAKYVASVAGK